MDQLNQPVLEFFTDERGIEYLRYGKESGWHQISPRRKQGQLVRLTVPLLMHII